MTTVTDGCEVTDGLASAVPFLRDSTISLRLSQRSRAKLTNAAPDGARFHEWGRSADSGHAASDSGRTATSAATGSLRTGNRVPCLEHATRRRSGVVSFRSG